MEVVTRHQLWTITFFVLASPSRKFSAYGTSLVDETACFTGNPAANDPSPPAATVYARAFYPPHAPGESWLMPANACFDTLMVTAGRSSEWVPWQSTSFDSCATPGGPAFDGG